MGLRLRDERPVEGVLADHGQQPGPHAVGGSDGKAREGEVA